ncbi:hypothetical protein KVR01_000235 [Diaporthe batatas]|uniref:uncharacterized protein n=1 Tax=Diaporthe batatas TaxID=748121 RepID=UPI001D03C40D|nr:uncharacterized protein KVR01_000235 [Diaporthe batatas]KAG8169490.1 hypothetical protein KVR01_000235 [Diaporthe batatas]
MIVLLEVLNSLSTRNGAIAKGHAKDHYLWTYGPAAILTLVASLFSRVEYQAKLFAPWGRLSKNIGPVQKNLLLDYVSDLTPVVIYESIADKDFAVAATTTISLVIKILIVLSSGFITLSRRTVHYATMPMEIQTAFVNNYTPVKTGTHLPHSALQDAIWGSSYSDSQGVSREFAYQSVQSSLPDTARFEVVVDGLSTNLNCEIAALHASDAVVGKFYSLMNVNTKSTGCDGVITKLLGPLPPFGNSDVFGPGQVAFGRVEQINCNATKDDASKRFLIMFGLEEWRVDEAIPPNEVIKNDLCPTGGCVNNLRGSLVKSAQLVCAPQYEITKVIVVQNATEVESVTRARESSTRTLEGLSSFRQYVGSQYDLTLWTGFRIGHDRLDVDQFMYTILEAEAPTGTTVASLYDPAFMQSMATRYFQRVGAVIATIVEDRLVAREWIVHCMAGLLSSCLFLTLVTRAAIEKRGTLHQAPSTLYRIAALVAHSPDLLDRLRYSGDADSKKLRLQLKRPTFQPELTQKGLKPPVLSTSNVAREGVPTTTSKPSGTIPQSPLTHPHPWILHPARSCRHNGLGDAGESPYIQYTWTSLPSLLFGGLAIIFSSMDFNIRSLVPYTCLSDGIAGKNFRTLDFLDMSVPSAIFKEAKLRNIGALATTTNLLVGSLFTVFSGSLFQANYVRTTESALLRADSSFGTPSGVFDVAPPSVLWSNRSYPNFTYEDLAFPQFLPEMTTGAQGFSNTSQHSIKAVVPALPSRPECLLYDVSIIRVENSESAAWKTLVIDIDDGRPKSVQEWSGFISINPDTLYFGTENVIGYDDNYFSWGYSIEMVDVNTTFTGADIAIDVQNPPQTLPDTEPALSAPLGLESLIALNKARVPANETNVLLDREEFLAGENDTLPRFEASVEDQAGRQRVVQDEASTRVLEALLLVTLVLLVVGWVWLPNTNVLPKRSPNTIASAVALLAGGNLTEWLHEEDGCVDTMKFWLGWEDLPPEEGISMGDGNEGRSRRFGIFAVMDDPDDDEQIGSLHGTST